MRSVSTETISSCGGYESREDVKTIDEDNNNDYNMKHQSNFGHRHCIELAARSSDTLGGTSRLRLTPFAPSQAGSTSYEKLLPSVTVINLQTFSKNNSLRTADYFMKSKGFDTAFSFQITSLLENLAATETQ